MLVGNEYTGGVDKGRTDHRKKIIEQGELKNLAYEDLILSIDTDSSVGNVLF